MKFVRLQGPRAFVVWEGLCLIANSMPDAAHDPVEKERLSDALRRVLEAAKGGPLTVREMITIMHGRGLMMIVILLCLPFLTPVAIPGISIPFGLAISLCGMRIAFGQKPWLPGFILNRRISYFVLENMVGFGSRVYEKAEKIIRPRLTVIFHGRAMRMVIGLAIALAGVLLSLPIPPPFLLTNTIPGFAIIFLALGLMERDGMLVVLGYALTILGTVYVAAIALLGREAVQELWRLFS